VVAGLAGVVDARAAAPLDEPGHQPQLLTPFGGRGAGAAVPPAGDLGPAVRRGVGLPGAAAPEGAWGVLRVPAAFPRVRLRPGGEHEVLRPRQTGRERPATAQGDRHLAAADEDGGRDAADGWAIVFEAAADPTETVACLGVEARRVPDGHALEVRAVRVRVADRLHDRQPVA